nr:unnamed protein product [Callosobruchus analis]
MCQTILHKVDIIHICEEQEIAWRR